MIQYHLDLQKQVKIIKEASLSQGQIQKIYSTAHYISISVRAPGKTWQVYFGRGSGNEGVWLHTSPPPSEIRRNDRFLEYLRKHLTSCSFREATLDAHDRIVKLTYQKFGQEQSFLWFWKGRKLYFLHHYQDQPEVPFKLLLSWRGKAFVPNEETLDLFEYFEEIGRRHDMNHDMSSPEITSMEDLLKEEMNSANFKESTSAPHFLQRKKENIEADLRRSKQWRKLQDVLDQNKTLDMYELKIDDQKVKFEGELNPFEKRNLVFQKIKKLKRGESILEDRLQQVEDLLSGTIKAVQKKSTVQMTKPVWGEEKNSTTGQSTTNKEEFKIYHFDHCQIGIGLNAHGNDQLRNKWANKDDYWIHLEGYKSSHAIIKLPQNNALSSEQLNLAASIVARFSHFNDDWIPVLYTQVKNLKGVSGAAGMVTYKKEKHLKCPKINLDTVFKE